MGLYTTTAIAAAPSANLDVYYLGFRNERAVFASGVGGERRHSIGTRFFGTVAGLDWDWEALWQFGTFAQQDIRAWGVSTNTGYTFETASWKVRTGIKMDVGSGDRSRSDTTLGTLNPLFPKLAYFNQAALLGPSNLMDIQPTLSIAPTRDLSVVIGYDFVWRATTADAIYTGTGLPIANTAGRTGKLSGRQLSVELSWSIDRHTQIGLGYVNLDAGNVLRMAGGHDVDFVFFSAAYKF